MKTIFLVFQDGKPDRAFEIMEEAWEYSEANPLAAFKCARVWLMEAGWRGNLQNAHGWNKPLLKDTPEVPPLTKAQFLELRLEDYKEYLKANAQHRKGLERDMAAVEAKLKSLEDTPA